MAPGDVYANLCGGGGGVGDPLDRDPAAVEHDVAEGLVTEAGAPLLETAELIGNRRQ